MSTDTLSPAEQAYFQSGGNDTEAVVKEYGGQLALDMGDQAPAAPEKSATPAPEAKAPDADGEEDGAVVIGPDGKARDANSGKYVPHAALHKERVRRQTVEGELQSTREKMARAEERLALLNELIDPDAAKTLAAKPAAVQAAAAKSALEEEPVDPEKDIFAAFKQVQRQNAELLKRMNDGQQQQEAKETAQTIASTYKADAQAFMQKTPDFKDAYVHLIENMHRELEALGMSDPAARNKTIAEREKDFVQEALRNKRSPSELLYTIAKTRGFSPKVPEAQPAPEANKAAEKIDNIKRGQGSVVSLAKAGGSGGDVLTLETLAAMSEDEFASVAKKLGKSQLRAMMGG